MTCFKRLGTGDINKIQINEEIFYLLHSTAMVLISECICYIDAIIKDDEHCSIIREDALRHCNSMRVITHTEFEKRWHVSQSKIGGI